MATTCGLCVPLQFQDSSSPSNSVVGSGGAQSEAAFDGTRDVISSFEEKSARGSALEVIPENSSNEENNEEPAARKGVNLLVCTSGNEVKPVQSDTTTPKVGAVSPKEKSAFSPKVLGENNKGPMPREIQVPTSPRTNDKDDDEDSSAKESLLAEVAVKSLPTVPTKDESPMEFSFEDVDSPMILDYDEGPSILYDHLQKKNWKECVGRLKEAPDEAKVWISRKEVGGALRWRLLPIHGAIVFQAPESVVQELVEIYSDAARAKDDQGMLPIHLSFKIGSSEAVVALLLAAFPECINVKDRKGRTPSVLAQKSSGPNKEGFLRALSKYMVKTKVQEKAPVLKKSPSAPKEKKTIAPSTPTSPPRIPKDAVSITSTIPSVVTASAGGVAGVNFAPNTKRGKPVNVLSSDEEPEQSPTAHPLVSKSKDREWKEVVDEIGDYVDKADLQDEVNRLEGELTKTKEASTVLSEHVASLESQLNTRSNTERFLATKIATLDTSLKLVTQSKEEVEASLRLDNSELAQKNAALEAQLASTQEVEGATSDDLKLEIEAKDARIRVLEAESAENRILVTQLESKCANVHVLQEQVSNLTTQLASAAEDTSHTIAAFSARVRSLESERRELRETISRLSGKLYKAASFLDTLAADQQSVSTMIVEEAPATSLRDLQIKTTGVRDEMAFILPKEVELGEHDLVDKVMMHLLSNPDDTSEEKKDDQTPLH